MFDGEIVKKKIPFKIILDLQNFWSKTESKTKLDLENFLSKTRSKTKLDLENFHQFFFAESLKMSCLIEKL